MTKDHNDVDFAVLAKKLGIQPYTITDCDDAFNGEIVYKAVEDIYEIYVNGKHSFNRKRFSIAHEIAHFIIHKELIRTHGSLKRNKDFDDKFEKQADDLAGKILIPTQLLNEWLNRNHVDKSELIQINTIQKLANHFCVSILVAKIRLENLGYYVPYISFTNLS